MSPVADASGVISGVAAPGPSPTRERKLSADHLTVAEFVEALDDAMEILLDVPATSSCIVESSAIKYDASDPVCTDEFDPVPGSFCYKFQTIISAPDPDDGNCEVNDAVEMATEELEDGGFEDAIGDVAGIVEVFVPTNAPTTAPSDMSMSMNLSVRMLKSRGATSKQRKAVVAAALADLAEQYLGRTLQTTRTKPKLNQTQRKRKQLKQID